MFKYLEYIVLQVNHLFHLNKTLFYVNSKSFILTPTLSCWIYFNRAIYLVYKTKLKLMISKIYLLKLKGAKDTNNDDLVQSELDVYLWSSVIFNSNFRTLIYIFCYMSFMTHGSRNQNTFCACLIFLYFLLFFRP